MDIALTIAAIIGGVYGVGLVLTALAGLLLRSDWRLTERQVGAIMLLGCWAWPVLLWHASHDALDKLRADAHEWRNR